MPPIRLLFAALNNATSTLQAELKPIHLFTLGAARDLSKKRIQFKFHLGVSCPTSEPYACPNFSSTFLLTYPTLDRMQLRLGTTKVFLDKLRSQHQFTHQCFCPNGQNLPLERA